MSQRNGKHIRFKKRIGPPLIMVGVAMFCLGFPLVFWGDPEFPGVTRFMLQFTVLPALFCLGFAMTLSRLQVEVSGTRKSGRLQIRLPSAGKTPWAPWTLHARDISVAEVSRIDVVLTAHSTEPSGVARQFIMRTKQGDYQFSSIWFSNTDAFASWCGKNMIELREGTPNQIMDAASPGEHQPTIGERFIRRCGWALGWIPILIMLCSVAAFIFGDSEARWIAVQAFVAAGAISTIAPLVKKHRQIR